MDYNGISQLDIFLSKTSSFEWFFNLVSSVKRLSRAEGSPDDATDRESIEACGTPKPRQVPIKMEVLMGKHGKTIDKMWMFDDFLSYRL